MKKILLAFLAVVITTAAYAQAPTFTGFSHPNVVTALYSDDTELFIGSRTPIPNNRLISYDGQSFNSIGYNESGYEIDAIGLTIASYTPPQTITLGLLVADKGTANFGYPGNVYSYDYSTFTQRLGYSYFSNILTTFLHSQNGNTYVGGSFNTIEENQTIVPTNGLAEIFLTGVVSETSLPSGTHVHSSLEYSSTYYIGTNGGLMAYNNQTSQFTVTSVDQTLLALESYNGIVYGSYFTQVYTWDGTGSEVLETTLTTNSVNCIKAFDGKLFFGGEELTMFNGSTWSTIATFDNGEIETMEVYDGKLYIGGDFVGVNGEPLAYLMSMDFSTVTDVSDLDGGINIYMPNPSDGLHMQSDNTLQVDVYDLTGKLVTSFNNVTFVDEQLDSGMYLVVLRGEGYVVTRRLVVTR